MELADVMPKTQIVFKMNGLHSILRQEIAAKGAITFARFMAQALYCPNLGYYERMEVSPGRNSDFYTSVSVGELFGELLARQFAQWLALLPPGPIQLLEAGAHNAALAADILLWLEKNQPDLFARLEYWFLEPSYRRITLQKGTLKGWPGKTRWFKAWEDLPAGGVNGIIFSNELLDAFPFHRLGWEAKKQTWFEWGVTTKKNAFVWTRLPLKNFPKEAGELKPLIHDLEQLPESLRAVLPDGFLTEICPAATAWWRTAAAHLKQGRLLTIDYGLFAEEFFMPQRQGGTARAYYRHKQENDLLTRIGEQDITAQVNFTAIKNTGEASGLKTESLNSQAQFLTTIVARALNEDSNFARQLAARSRQFQTLTHPEHLGRSFRVLVQAR